MTLKEWMQQEKLSQPEAAKRLGVSQQNISNWATGKNEPTLRMAVVIQKKTHGAVTVEELAVKP